MRSSIRRLDGCHFELTLEGSCPNPHWTPALFSSLSAHGVSVVLGKADRSEGDHWQVRLVLDFSRSATAPESLDYVKMMLSRLPLTGSEPPLLSRFSVQRRADDSIEIHLAGPDQVGFLGRVLLKIAALGLYPVGLDIRTIGGQINDQVVVRGIGGSAPGEAIRKSLEIMLCRFVPVLDAGLPRSMQRLGPGAPVAL